MSKTSAHPTGLRDRPAYPLGEAARYVRVAPATLRSWVVGRPYATNSGVRHSPALIKLADHERRLFSFNNLIESHVLRALRTARGIPVKAIRKALQYAADELGESRLLLHRKLSTNAQELFVEEYGQLINLTRSGQLAMRELLASHLQRVEWDRADMPLRLFPFVRADEDGRARPITIDPAVGFGRPTLTSRGISTQVIAQRIDAGESPEEVAADYEVSPSEVTEAVIYERAA